MGGPETEGGKAQRERRANNEKDTKTETEKQTHDSNRKGEAKKRNKGDKKEKEQSESVAVKSNEIKEKPTHFKEVDGVRIV